MAPVAAETRGAVGLARLDRPDARNALSPELMEELAAICERWDEDPDVRCIVIAGGDDWFAAGADIKAMAKRTFAEALTSPAGALLAAARRAPHAAGGGRVRLRARRRLRAGAGLRHDRRLRDAPSSASRRSCSGSSRAAAARSGSRA